MSNKFILGTGRQSLENCYSVLGWRLPPNLPEEGFDKNKHGDGKLHIYNGPDGQWCIKLSYEELAPKQPLIKQMRCVSVRPEMTECFEE